ncbi:MAG: hypothetical protein K6F82_05590 [Sphaerochaetaceae bacterium]|nr:hypothetical protein [Sphaerochaetaceae bacterium]
MNEEYTEINLVDLLALVFKKFNVFVLAAVVGLVLGVGINYLSVSQPSKMAAYEKDIVVYEETLSAMEENLENLKASYELQKALVSAYSYNLEDGSVSGLSEDSNGEYMISLQPSYSESLTEKRDEKKNDESGYSVVLQPSIVGAINTESKLYSLIVETEDEIDKFISNKPVYPAPSPLKYGLIGAFVGIFVMLCIYCFPFIIKMPLTSSYSFEDRTKVSFMGALFSDNKFWSKIARKMIGERFWRTETEASEYLKENIASLLESNSKIAVISSLSETELSLSSEKIIEALESIGHEVVLVSQAQQNPKFFSAINNANYIVLLEKQWISSSHKVISNMEKITSLNKNTAGFILC